MRYARIITSLLAIILLLICLYGCGSGTKKYNAYTVFLRGSPEAEEVWQYPDVDDYSGPSEASVTVNGVTYTGSYIFSSVENPYYYDIVHKYDGNGFSFSIRESDGKLKHLSIDTELPPSTSLLDEKTRRQIADDLADDYIALNQVKVTTREEDGCFVYHYCVLKQDYMTWEYVHISLRGDGTLDTLRVDMQGAFNNVKKVKIDENRVESAVEKKMEDFFEIVAPKNWTCEYDIHSVLLAKMANNQCALEYNLKYRCENPDETNHIRGSVSLLVIVDHVKYNPFKP